MKTEPSERPTVPTVGQLRGHVRQVRNRHHPQSLTRRVIGSDRPFWVVLLGGLLVELERTALTGATIHLPPATLWSILLLGLIALTAAAKGLLTFGPLLVGAPTQSWLLGTPTSRSALLRPRYTALIAVAAACLGYLATLLVPLGTAPLSALPAAILAGLAGGAAVAAGTVLAQLAGTVRTAQRVLSAVLALEIATTIAVSLTGATLPPPRLATGPLSMALLPAIPLAGALVGLGYQRLGRATSATLAHGSDLVTAAAAALSWMDLAVLTETLAVRTRRAAGKARSRTIRGSRTTALLRAERIRLVRSPGAALAWLVLASVPYVAHALLTSPLLSCCYTVACFLATYSLAGGLREVARHDALRQSLGGRDRDLILPTTVIPIIGTLIWCAGTFAALPQPHIAVVVLAAASALTVTYRIATKPPMDYTSPLLDTPFGTIPINVVRQLARGPALLLAIVVVQYVITFNANVRP